MRISHAVGATYTIIVFGVMLIPIFLVLPLSLTAQEFMTLPPRGLTLHWFQVFFTNPDWTHPFLFSLWLGVASATLATFVGGLAAWPLSRARFRGRGAVQALLLSPMVVPSICLAVGSFLVWARFDMLGNPIALIATHVTLASPYVIVVLSAAIGGIEEEQLRAAQSLGANAMAVVRRIIVPIILPSIITAWVFALSVSLDEVVLTRFLLRAGQTQTLSVFIFGQLEYSLSPVIAVSSVVYVTFAMFVAVWAATQSKGQLV